MSDEAGQDLVEYTLLIAFVVATSAALLVDIPASAKPIWDKTVKNLETAVEHPF